jgi:hypothetical protein
VSPKKPRVEHGDECIPLGFVCSGHHDFLYAIVIEIRYRQIGYAADMEVATRLAAGNAIQDKNH